MEMCLDRISARKKRKHLQSHLRLARLPLARVPASPPCLAPLCCSVIHVPLRTPPEPPVQLHHLLKVPTLQKPPELCPQQDTPLEGVSHHPCKLQLTVATQFLGYQSLHLATGFPSADASLRRTFPKRACCGFSPLIYLVSQSDRVTGFLAKTVRT